MIKNFEELLSFAAGIPAKRAVVVNPANEETFQAIREAREKLGVRFLLVGDRKIIEAAVTPADGVEIFHHPDLRDCLRVTLELLKDDKAGILLKGSVDTGALMKAALQAESGLRTGRLLSDVFIFEYPPRTDNKLIMITDGGLTLAPDLKAKVELIRNAVEVAHALGNPNPKVAVLSATEFVQPDLPSTVDAAVLSKMNERGQIKGCVVEGPLALDNALQPHAAGEKGIRSPVAGAAEILVCPSIEAANSLAKATTYIGNMRLGHVIVGARVPILIPSRADKSDAKLLSLALGMIMSDQARRSP